MSINKKSLDFEISFYEGVIKRNPDYVDALIPLAELYTRNGLYQKGLEIDKHLAHLCKDDPVIHYNLACSLALLNKKEESLANLRRAIKLGYCDFDHLRKDPDFRCLHGHPDFENIIESYCS